uniref:AAA+ ATPase domain-containing protein n=1 Tax=Phyllocladus aspleniifolius TaxID=120602 RepID=A0A3T0ZE33_9CONI|nr:hypothetical protein [Phyllocladus aspleniifolius]
MKLPNMFKKQFPHRFRLEMLQLFNPWNKSYLAESYLFRWLTQIFFCRERLIKLLNFRIIITLFLRDLRSLGVNKTIKVVALLTLPVFLYQVNFCWAEKNRMMFIAPNFTKNLLMVPHLFVYLSKYDTNLINNKNEKISENQGPKSWETSSKSDQSFKFLLLKRQQDDHPFQRFLKLERKRKVDFWKTKTYLFKYRSSNCVSVRSLDPEWNVFSKRNTDLNHFNCIRFMNRNSPWKKFLLKIDKEQWKKAVLEITDQFCLSMIKPQAVDDSRIFIDLIFLWLDAQNTGDHMVEHFFKMSGDILFDEVLANKVFKRRVKLKDQLLMDILDDDRYGLLSFPDDLTKVKLKDDFLLKLLNNPDYNRRVLTSFPDELIEGFVLFFADTIKDFVNQKIYLVDQERAKTLVHLKFIYHHIYKQCKMKVDSQTNENVLKFCFNVRRFYVYLKYEFIDDVFIYNIVQTYIVPVHQNVRRLYFYTKIYLKYDLSKDLETLSNWIKDESLNNVMKNAVNQDSLTWRFSQKLWLCRSIIQIEPHVKRNLIVYNWSTQTEYWKNGIHKFVSSVSYHYVKMKNIFINPNEYRVWVPRDIRLLLKEFIEFFLFEYLYIDLFDNKLCITIHFPTVLPNWWSNFRSKFITLDELRTYKSVIVNFFLEDEEEDMGDEEEAMGDDKEAMGDEEEAMGDDEEAMGDDKEAMANKAEKAMANKAEKAMANKAEKAMANKEEEAMGNNEEKATPELTEEQRQKKLRRLKKALRAELKKLYSSMFDLFICLLVNLNYLFKLLFNLLWKWIQSIVVQSLDDSQISESNWNEIPINQLIRSLCDNQKNGMDVVDNTDLWARLNDRNWLNPLKLSNKSSLRTCFDKANTIEFFDYLHHPRLNYKKRLFPYMENSHIKTKNLPYVQLFNFFPVHNSLFPLPIDEINPFLLKKEIISLIKSQVANKLLAHLRGRTLIHDSYKSLNLLTLLNHFVHAKKAFSSIEEISATPFTREQQIVDFEKKSCPPFFNSLDSKENNFSGYKGDLRKDIYLIQKSYAEDLQLLFETLFMKMNNIEKFVKKSTSTENLKNIIKEEYLFYPWWKCLVDTLSDTCMEIKKSTLLNKDKKILSRVFQFQINASKWEYLETYKFCFFTTAWWKYLADIYLYPLLQILINIRDKSEYILDILQYENEFLIHILEIFNILWALPHKLWAILKWKLKKNGEKFYNRVFDYVVTIYNIYKIPFYNFCVEVFYSSYNIYKSVSSWFYKLYLAYFSQILSAEKIADHFSEFDDQMKKSEKWIWYFDLLSSFKSSIEEEENKKEITFFSDDPYRDFTFEEFKEMKIMEKFKILKKYIRYVKNGLIKNEKSLVLYVFYFAVGYFLLRLFLVPLQLLDLTRDFILWKSLEEDPSSINEFCDKLQTLVEPMPEMTIGWFIDYEDFRIPPIKKIYKALRRKRSCTRELKRKHPYLFSFYTTLLETPYYNVSKYNIDTPENNLANFLINDKSVSQLELKILTDPKDFNSNWPSSGTADSNQPIAGYINEQPGPVYLRYLAEAFQEGRINYTHKFDPFGSAQKAVFLAFCHKITFSKKDSYNLNYLKPNFIPLNLGPSFSYFSKRILLIGPMGTGRSYLAKSLAADSYVPLVKISLSRFLFQEKNDWKHELRELREMGGDPMLYVPSIFDPTAENEVERRGLSDSLLNGHLWYKRVEQFQLVLDMAKAMSPCVIWIPNVHELGGFASLFLCMLVESLFKGNFPGIVIASTHLPKKVDPLPIGTNGLDKSIHIRMLPFSQRQREFALLLRSKGFSLEKEFFTEFGFRTKGFNARDLAGLTNKVFLMGLAQKGSVIDTKTMRRAFNRNTQGLFGFDSQFDVRLPYKVGKAFIQHIFSSKDPLFARDFWTKRAFYLSHWYLEPRIAGTSINEFTLFCHILGCLAGSAAQDSWYISERDRENWRPIDKFIRNDFALASSLLESLLMEFSLGTYDREESKFSKSTILSSAGQDIVVNHFNMMDQGVSSFVNKTILRKEYFFEIHEADRKQEFKYNITWSHRTWRFSFLRSNQFDLLRRSNQFIDLLQDYENFNPIKEMAKRIDPPYRKSNYTFRARKRWRSEIKTMLKGRRVIFDRESFDNRYQMQYESYNDSIFFLERFLWNPSNALFIDKRIYLFSRREYFINEEMLRRTYITYIPRRKNNIKNPFRGRDPFRRGYFFSVDSANRLLKMKTWNLEDILPGKPMKFFQRVQALGSEWRRSALYRPMFAYTCWLYEYTPRIDQFELSVDRQRRNTRCLSESFIYNFLSESYLYLIDLFLSNRMLLDKLTNTVLKKKILYADEIRDLVGEETNRNKRD